MYCLSNAENDKSWPASVLLKRQGDTEQDKDHCRCQETRHVARCLLEAKIVSAAHLS